MKFQPSIRVQVKVQTPVFIWDGEEVRPLSYVTEGSVVHVIDDRRFLNALNPCEQQAYISWVESVLQRLEDLDKRLQTARNDPALKRQRIQEEAGFSLEYFLRQQLRTDPVAFLRKKGCIAYSVQCNARLGSRGFRSFIKEAGYRPFVPGTELKGALRTALLLALVEEKEGYDRLRRELTEFRKITSPRERLARLSKIAPRVEGGLLRGSQNDAKYDLLKLIQVSDGELLASDSLSLYALESVGTSRTTLTFAEGLKKGVTFAFRLSIASVEDVEWALKKLGLAQKARAFLTPDTLIKAIHRRSARLLEEDERYFRDSPNILKEIQRLKNENRPDTPLMRLGTGQGFLSVTVNLPVRRRDPELYDEVIRAEISRKRKWRTKQNNFPCTRRVVTDGKGEPLTLPGYIQISMYPE